MQKEMQILSKNVLSQILESKKNIQIFTKYLIKTTDNMEEFKKILYQLTEDLVSEKETLKEILLRVSKKEVGWNHPNFNNIKRKIHEHDEFIVNPFDVAEGVVECRKCKSKKTYSFTKQCRSADEPATLIARCVICGNSWTQSA